LTSESVEVGGEDRILLQEAKCLAAHLVGKDEDQVWAACGLSGLPGQAGEYHSRSGGKRSLEKLASRGKGHRDLLQKWLILKRV